MYSVKKRILIIFGIVWSVSAVMLFGGYYFFVLPQKTEMKSLKDQLEQLQSVDAKTRFQEKAKQQLAHCNDLKKQLSDFIIDTDSWIEIMPYVSNLAQEEDVLDFSSKDISTNKFGNAKDLSKIETKTLSVTFDSSFAKFARYINRLEAGKPVLFVNEFSIERNPDDFEAHAVKMDLQVIIGKNKNQIKDLLVLSQNPEN